MPFIPNKEELAWAAGFFDGEGSVHVCHSGTKGRKYLPYPQVTISQSGELGAEPLEKFNLAIGNLGKIYGPKPPGKNQKQIRWMWEASGFKKTQVIMALLWKYLGTVKRNKFQQVTKAYLDARR